MRNIQNYKELIERLQKQTSHQFIEKNMVTLPIGSVYRYIHVDWLIKGLQEEAIKENAYGQFCPVAYAFIEDVVIGKQGRKTLTRPEQVLRFDKFYNWHERYEKFLYATEQDAQSTRALQFSIKGGEKK